jgi:hypothetical protein
MSMAVIVSRPSQAPDLMPHLCHLWPDEPHFDFLAVQLRGFYRPAWPHGLRWQDYPYLAPWDTESPRFVPRTEAGPAPWVGRLHVDSWKAYVKQRDPAERHVPSQAPFATWCPNASLYEDRLHQASHVLAAMDPHPSSAFAAALLKRQFVSRQATWEVMEIHASDPASLRQALANRAPQPEWFDKSAAYGETKAYFDHQFALNSLAILGKTFVRPDQPQLWVSKYQIQLLFALGRLSPAREGEWSRRMRAWRGTGKYFDVNKPAPPQPKYLGSIKEGMGSAASRMPMFQKMVSWGWICRMDDRRNWGLSEEGRRALDALHPKCEDPDLPFRLDEWCRQGLAVSRPSMDRYLRTFFGRQKNLLDSKRR